MSIRRSVSSAVWLTGSLALAALAMLLLASMADASEWSAAGGMIVFQSTPGASERMEVGRNNLMPNVTGTLFAPLAGGAELTAGSGCERYPANGDVACTTLDPVLADLGDGDDTLVQSQLTLYLINATIHGGSGNDTLSAGLGRLYGDGGNDSLRFVPYHGNRQGLADLLDGGPGDDTLAGIDGADTVIGSSGTDTASFRNTSLPVSVTLDDEDDDGVTGDHANIRSDVENVIGSTADDLLVGSAASNRLDGDLGNDTVQGNGGSDTLLGGPGDDEIRSHDGQADVVDCGTGEDTAVVDPRDSVTNCERVILPDDDRDGVTAPSDCNDANAGIHPGAIDVPNDGVDEDCVGGDAVAVVDADGDGASSATDCDDHDPRRFPGHRDVPGDRIDQNCDGHDAAFPQQGAGVLFTTVGVRPHRTRFLVLTAVAVRRGDTIRLQCKGHGCPRRAVRRRVARSGHKVKLLRGVWKHATLGPGARVTVTFTRAGFAEKRFRFTTRRKFGAAPIRVVTCRPPGGRRTRC